MAYSKRCTRQFLVVGVVLIVGLYLPLNLFYLLFAAPRQAERQNRNAERSHQNEETFPVRISDIQGDDFGNVRVVLSLNVHDLLDLIDQGKVNSGEATANPPPKDVKFVINNPDVCKNSSKVKYLAYIHTSPENDRKRNLLRDTWISRTLFRERIIERIFLMGRSDKPELQAKIRAEAEKHGDIVQGDFADNYKNLTLKGLMGLKWVALYCPNVEFVIKADDDAFVNVFGLLGVLRKHGGKRKLVACPLWGDNSMPILRDPSKCLKWCVKYNEFPGRRFFPKYCAGLTFVLSTELARQLYNVSRTTPFFWIDDVYVTGILPGKVADVQYVSLIKNFTLKQDEAVAQLKNASRTFDYLFVHAKRTDGYMQMWQLLLNRLTIDDAKLLSTDVIENTPVLKKLLSSDAKKKS